MAAGEATVAATVTAVAAAKAAAAKAAAARACSSELRDLRGGTLREVRAIESVGHVPDGVALGAARGEGNRPVAIVASRREGLDLFGWARIAARRAGDRPLHEVYVAAPFFSARTRAAAERAAERGPILHLADAAEPGRVRDVRGRELPAAARAVAARRQRVAPGARAASDSRRGRRHRRPAPCTPPAPSTRCSCAASGSRACSAKATASSSRCPRPITARST